MFCCTLLYVHSSFAIILMGKRGQVALLSLSSSCLVSLARGTMGLSAVCDYVISWSCSLNIFHISAMYMIKTKRQCNNGQNQSLKWCERKVGDIRFIQMNSCVFSP